MIWLIVMLARKIKLRCALVNDDGAKTKKTLTLVVRCHLTNGARRVITINLKRTVFVWDRRLLMDVVATTVCFLWHFFLSLIMIACLLLVFPNDIFNYFFQMRLNQMPPQTKDLKTITKDIVMMHEYLCN